MSQILVDTSVWVDYFNGKNPKAGALSDLIDGNALCTNDLILAELVPFIRHSGEAKLIELLYAVQKHELTIDWRRILDYQTLNLRKGTNKVGISDLIIVQQVIDLQLTLFAFDQHFELMSKYHDYEMYKI